VKGEKTKGFLVLVGWQLMAGFELCMKSESVKEALPLLMAWNAPYKMVRRLVL
jgi:hypothetical protein